MCAILGEDVPRYPGVANNTISQLTVGYSVTCLGVLKLHVNQKTAVICLIIYAHMRARGGHSHNHFSTSPRFILLLHERQTSRTSATLAYSASQSVQLSHSPFLAVHCIICTLYTFGMQSLHLGSKTSIGLSSQDKRDKHAHACNCCRCKLERHTMSRSTEQTTMTPSSSAFKLFQTLQIIHTPRQALPNTIHAISFAPVWTTPAGPINAHHGVWSSQSISTLK